jgi:hypothetical protein
MPRHRLLIALSLVAAATLVSGGLAPDAEAHHKCNPGHPCPTPDPTPTDATPTPTDATPTPTVTPTDPATSEDPVLTAAGDIADPVPSVATIATADLITSIDPTVALTLGDNQYETGLLSDFLTGYGSTWGAFRSDTHPAIGNHEYKSSDTAEGYFSYFGDQSPNNYYSYDVGAWHLISLDSNCDIAGGCGPGSPQYEWLQADLAADPALCTLAYWHHPRWSSGTHHGNTGQVEPFVRLLYEAGADVILSGHEHNYERYAPQAPGSELDLEHGLTEFVVGTGGRGLSPLGDPDPNSIVGSDSTFGVLEMTLHPTGYDFAFRAVLGSDFTDSGAASCH